MSPSETKGQNFKTCLSLTIGGSGDAEPAKVYVITDTDPAEIHGAAGLRGAAASCAAKSDHCNAP